MCVCVCMYVSVLLALVISLFWLHTALLALYPDMLWYLGLLTGKLCVCLRVRFSCDQPLVVISVFMLREMSDEVVLGSWYCS